MYIESLLGLGCKKKIEILFCCKPLINFLSCLSNTPTKMLTFEDYVWCSVASVDDMNGDGRHRMDLPLDSRGLATGAHVLAMALEHPGIRRNARMKGKRVEDIEILYEGKPIKDDDTFTKEMVQKFQSFRFRFSGWNKRKAVVFSRFSSRSAIGLGN